MPRLLRTRLSAMMFVFYFGLGSWVVTLATYLMSAPIRGGLNFSTGEVALVYSAFAFGGMIAPLVIGILSDQLFRGEVVLGVTSLLCAGLLLAAGHWCDVNFPKMDAAYRAAAARERVNGVPPLELFDQLNGKPAATDSDRRLRDEVRRALDRVNDDPQVRAVAAATFERLFVLMLAYCICMQLSLTLTTVISLRNLPDPGHSFFRVRLFGTVGWIAAGNTVGFFLRPASSDVLYLAAAGSVMTGLYAFTLPKTPPMAAGRSVGEIFGLPALRLFLDRSFVIFAAVAFLTTVNNQFYVVYGHRYLMDHGVPEPVQLMTIAQVVEVCCMFLLPILRPKDRMKWLMVVGLGGYALRGIVMMIGWVPAVIALGVPMHGWSYTFFFVVAATYLDREAPPHLRASAQGIITFVCGGVGVWLGNIFAGWVVDHHRVGTAIDWSAVWQTPLVVCAILVIGFVVLFHPPRLEMTKTVGHKEAQKGTKD